MKNYTNGEYTNEKHTNEKYTNENITTKSTEMKSIRIIYSNTAVSSTGEYCRIFKNIYFENHLRMSASGLYTFCISFVQFQAIQ